MCLSVCVSVLRRMHRPGFNLKEWYGVPPICARLGGFAIGARVSLLYVTIAPNTKRQRVFVLALCL